MVRANRACQLCLKDVTELNSCGSYAVESTDISVSKTEESRAMVRANGADQRCLLIRCNRAKQLRKLRYGIDIHLSAEKLRSRERWLELIELAKRCLKDVTELNSCGSYAVESTDISVHKRRSRERCCCNNAAY